MPARPFGLPIRRWFTLAVAVVLAIALSSCQFPRASGESQVPTLVLSTLSDPKTFNTVISQEANPAFSFIEEGLITSDNQGRIMPALAESWTFSEDKRSITFTLRENLRWSDNHPLTVDDVVFTYNDLYLNEKIPADFRDLLRIGSEKKLPIVTKLNERQVKFTIPEPFAPFLRYTGVGIMPKHILETAAKTLDERNNPIFIRTWGVGTDPKEIVVPGPYQIDSYRTGERIILRRNPHYWRKDSDGQPQPYIERIAIQIVENQDTSLLQFRTGGLDSVGANARNFALLKSEEKSGNFTIYEGGPDLSQSFIVFNLNKGSRNGKPLVDPIKSEWFNTLEFRQAIAYGIDRRKMLVNIYQGLGQPQHSYMPVQSPYYLTPEEGLPIYEYDPEKARSLLQQGGFQYDAEGQLTDAAGNLVRFTLYTNAGNQIRDSMGSQIKQDLGKLGIRVDFTPIAFNALVEKLTGSLEWEAYILGFSGGGVEPHSSANVWLSDGGLHTFNQKPRTGPNLTGREVTDWEKEIDRLYIAASQEVDEAKRKELYGQAQTIVLENLPFIYLINPYDFTAVRNRVKGIDYSALGGSTWNIYEQTLEE